MKILFSTLFLLISFSQNVFAISEGNYQQEYQNKIMPLIHSMDEGRFIGEKNISIHYRTFIQENAKNCLVILPGRTEPVEKYAEVIYDLLQTDAGKNLNFFLLDHRGQGSSGRMAKPFDVGHIDHFSHYVADLETFIKNQNLEKNCHHRFLLAHSLGAGISVSYLLKNPNFFDKIALSSPMLKIQTKPYAYAVARTIVEAANLAGLGAKFAPGQKGFDPNETFVNNKFTTSPERFFMAMNIFEILPTTKLGGVSNRWILEVMKGTNPIRSRYHEISAPMRVFHAGIEEYSESSEMEKLCTEAANCQRTFLPTSKHEVLMDRDVNRNIVINELSNFFNN